MRTFNKQAVSLKKNLKQNNLMPLFVVFSVIVMLSLTYKSASKVNGVGNTMFKEGNRNRRRRVRQGFREGNEESGVEEHFDVNEEEEAMKDATSPAPEGFLNGGGIGRKAGFVGREGLREGARGKRGKARQGEARQGEARQGEAKRGGSRDGRLPPRPPSQRGKASRARRARSASQVKARRAGQ